MARDFRRNSTAGERLLWERLRNRQVAGREFRRQHAIGRFIVDFFCVEEKLAIEVDGPVHRAQREYDVDRQAYLEEQGVTFLRFPNDEARREMQSVLIRIAAVLRSGAE